MALFLLLQVQKKNFIENIIPIIISLKTVLEKNKIPALRELMTYLRVKDDLVLCGQCLPPLAQYSGSVTVTMVQLVGEHRNSKCCKNQLYTFLEFDQPDRPFNRERV